MLHAGYVNSPVHDGLFGLALSHPVLRATVTGIFQSLAGTVDQRMVSLAVDAPLGGDRSARIAVVSRTDSPDQRRDDLSVIGGVDQRLSSHLLVFVELFVRDSDATGVGESAGVSGLRFDF